MNETNIESFRVRHRVNFSVSVKGVVTPDVTVEMINSTKEEVIEEAKAVLTLAMITANERSVNN